MDESVNMESDPLSKGDENKKCISQKSAKFSIDSLLAINENVTNQSDSNVLEECSQIESALSNYKEDSSQRHFSELSSTDDTLRRESEVVSTTEGFYEKNFTEGM